LLSNRWRRAVQDHSTHRWLAIGMLAAAAFTVSAAVAAGQDSNAPAAQSSGSSMSGSAPAASAAASANAPDAASASATADSSSAPTPPPTVGGVTHVTNGPVPDTPDSRTRYGAPMSNAGQTTTPAGN